MIFGKAEVVLCASILLGAAEAGFFRASSSTYELVPRGLRSRTTAVFMTAAVLSNVVGSPLSGCCSSSTHLGLRGWKWLFIVEALPSCCSA